MFRDSSGFSARGESFYGVQGDMKVYHNHRCVRGSSSDCHVDGDNRRFSTPLPSHYRLPSRDPHTPPNERYSQLLMEECRGYPLWFPQPNAQLVAEYTRRGAEIGDVGLLKEDGSFDFLFSIIHPPDHPVNVRHGVPQGFEPLNRCHLDKHEIQRYHCDDHHLCSPKLYVSKHAMSESRDSSEGSYGRSGFNFLCGDGVMEGAVLILPDGCSRTDLANKDNFLDQAIKHGASWLEYAASRGRKTTTLYLITGCDKASSWGIASFLKHLDARLSLSFYEEKPNREGETTYKWSNDPWSTSRCSPETRRNPRLASSDDENQCVFLRSFTISRHEKSTNIKREDDDVNEVWLREPQGNRRASTSRSPFASRSQDALNLTICESKHKPYHPCRDINLFLHNALRTSFVSEDEPLSDEIPIFVISHDDDWSASTEHYPLPPVSIRHLCEALEVEVRNNVIYTSKSPRSSDLRSLMSQKLHVSRNVTDESTSEDKDDIKQQEIRVSAVPSSHSTKIKTRSLTPQPGPSRQTPESSTRDPERLPAIKRSREDSRSPSQSSRAIEGDKQFHASQSQQSDRLGGPFSKDKGVQPMPSTLGTSSLLPHGNEIRIPDVQQPKGSSYDAQSLVPHSGERPLPPTLFPDVWLRGGGEGDQSAFGHPTSCQPDTEDLMSEQNLASKTTIEAAERRRKRKARFSCLVEGCDQTFTAKHNLRNHTNAHLGIKEYQCSSCSAAFVTRSDCKRHERTCKKAQGPVALVEDTPDARTPIRNVVEGGSDNLPTHSQDVGISSTNLAHLSTTRGTSAPDPGNPEGDSSTLSSG